MNPIDFCEKYYRIKLSHAQKEMMRAIMSGKRIVITRPRPHNKSIFYEELAKAFKSGRHVLKRTPLIIADEYSSVSPEWIEAKRKEWNERSPTWEDRINGNWPAE